MKTKYDWVPGRRGVLLKPEHSDSMQQTVVVTGARNVLRELFEADRLRGTALADARIRYEFKEKGAVA